MFLLFLVLAVLFKELVKQHRVHSVIAHRVRFSFLVGQHEPWIHLCDFLGDQTKLRRAFGVRLVVERDRLSDMIASLLRFHRHDLFLNRSEEAAIPSCPWGHDNWRSGATLSRINVTDKAAALTSHQVHRWQ